MAVKKCKNFSKMQFQKHYFQGFKMRELRDIIVMNAVVGLVQNDDLTICKKSFSKSMFTKDKYSKI